MAKKCTAYGPRRPEDFEIKDFLDFSRSLERLSRKPAGETEEDRQREEEWKEFSARFNDSKE